MFTDPRLAPLSEGNGLQRAYARWAEPHYQRMAPALREQVVQVDRWLYSRSGMGFWLGVLGAFAGALWGLRASGLPWWAAILAGLVACLWMPLVALAVWWMPGHFTGAKAVRQLRWVVPLALVAGLLGFGVGHFQRHGWHAWGLLGERLRDNFSVLAPAVLLLSIAMVGLIWGTARIREQVLQRQLAQAHLAQERDAARREAVQAQLKLLQGQIQPHFIFNTLAAAQHWVDQGDARAAHLLRALTAFLRSSTEMLVRDHVGLAEEAQTVRHYLGVMSLRLGARLHWRIAIDPAAAAQALPPGLLLTLVENAVEHGVCASLHGAEVVLDARRDGQTVRISVRDSAALWNSASAEGVGLRNSRERLRHLYGDAAELSLGLHKGCTEATLKLPATAESPPSVAGL